MEIRVWKTRSNVKGHHEGGQSHTKKGIFRAKVTLVGLQGRGATQTTLSSKENCLTFNLDTQQVLPIVPLLWDMNEIYWITKDPSLFKGSVNRLALLCAQLLPMALILWRSWNQSHENIKETQMNMCKFEIRHNSIFALMWTIYLPSGTQNQPSETKGSKGNAFT